jgi:hypothetical protein
MGITGKCRNYSVETFAADIATVMNGLKLSHVILVV